ncbi:ATP-dependent DNA helicase PIF1-like [Pelobates cultripes]|uniref:ATP-dependent DNA helicase n=1 Tax=Pelobates cultripes TaxID=61616 RepID=A0AAD1SWX2_PELCU|nr:ATP-dependent DNA helicase PIF1-like [Pelobates cultripes]
MEQVLDDFLKNGPVEDPWNTFAPEAKLDRLECIEERKEGEPLHENEQDDVPENTHHKQTGGIALTVKAPQMCPDFLRKRYRNLNWTQAQTFYSVCDWCTNHVRDLNPDPFYYFVTGGAGTGKSHLIKCIYAEATKILCKLTRLREEADISTPIVLLTAFTGTAAFNISGNTLHSLLKLPRSLKPPYQGLGNHMYEVRAQLSNAEIIVIDEVSMMLQGVVSAVGLC